MTKQLKIGFDAKRLFNNFTGLGNYSRSLVKALQQHFPKHEYHLFTPGITQSEETKYFLNPDRFIIHNYQGPFKSWWRSFGVTKELQKHGIDLYHGLSNEIPFNIHKIQTKSVVTIHDVIFRERPLDYPVLDRILYDIKTKKSLETADRIVAISEATKKSINRYYNIEADKVSIIPPALEDEFFEKYSTDELQKFKAKHKLPPSYLLYVGSITSRKNLLTLVNALHLIPDKNRPHLVMVGDGKKYKQKVQSYISKHNLETWFTMRVHVTNKDLKKYYQASSLFIFPSLNEGFGLPVIEALASGVPVVTHNNSSLPEAIGIKEMTVNCTSPEELKRMILKWNKNNSLLNDYMLKIENRLTEISPNNLSKKWMNLYKDSTR